MLTDISIAVYAILTAALAIGLPWAVLRNVRQGDRYRRGLLEQLQQLPLHEILQRHGIDPVYYLHSERMADVSRHMRRCGTCQERKQCAAQLRAGADISAFHFCPNRAELTRGTEQPAALRADGEAAAA
jgi:predicted RecB family nuclease